MRSVTSTHVLSVVSQTRVSGGNRTHDPYANSLAYYLLDYQGTHSNELLFIFIRKLNGDKKHLIHY